MRRAPHFLRSESGAVTVDYVVLLAVAAGVAFSLLLVSSGGFGQLLRATEQQSLSQGYTTNSAAEAIRRYEPTNALLHQTLREDFAGLDDKELDTIEAFVNEYVDRMAPLAVNASDAGVLADLDFAMSHAYVDRFRRRPHGEKYDVESVGAIALKLGWDDGVKEMFADP